jgi:predicted nuclease with TOPRIM domain
MEQETFQYIIIGLSSVSVLAIVITAIRGVVTRKDLKEYKEEVKSTFTEHKETCYNGIAREFRVRDEKLDRGDDKFKEINSTLTSQGEEISGIAQTVSAIGATVDEMSSSVKALVKHHIEDKGD